MWRRKRAGWCGDLLSDAYAPDLNPAEGIWSLLKRSMANFAAADVDGTAVLQGPARKSSPSDHMHYEFNLVNSARVSRMTEDGTTDTSSANCCQRLLG
jgi:hypothetical protein